MTPDEIGRPAQKQATFFMPETPVFQGHLTPYYQIPTMLNDIDKYSTEEYEVKLRTSPITYEEVEQPLPQKVQTAPATGVQPNAGQPIAKITPNKVAARPSDQELWKALNELKDKTLDWENTKGDAKKWWEAFEEENKTRIALVLKVAQEIASRKASITDFFLAYVYSNTDNIQATLAYLDYTLHMKQATA